jgi:hypothetical protein
MIIITLYNIMLDYYEVKIAAPSTEISELVKLLQSLDN